MFVVQSRHISVISVPLAAHRTSIQRKLAGFRIPEGEMVMVMWLVALLFWYPVLLFWYDIWYLPEVKVNVSTLVLWYFGILSLRFWYLVLFLIANCTNVTKQ
eukprot:Lithocolla_globosa_v1_NODE_664_length_3481_cov_56.430239.p5 type:complete len:102 gc:universal NODE_664_length_3481_cov_56.430239:1069-1374(+)